MFGSRWVELAPCVKFHCCSLRRLVEGATPPRSSYLVPISNEFVAIMGLVLRDNRSMGTLGPDSEICFNPGGLNCCLQEGSSHK